MVCNVTWPASFRSTGPSLNPRAVLAQNNNDKRGQVILNSEGHRLPDELGPAVAILGIL